MRATIKTFLSDEQLKDGYDKTLPVMWFLKAENLLDAARLLEPYDLLFNQVKSQKAFSETTLNLMSIILMLRGMALECLLKGELTRQGKIIPKDGKLDLPKKYTGHDLSTMALDVEGLSLEEDEHITLQTLSQQIMLARLPLKQAPNKAQMEQGGWTFPHDEKVYLGILDKLNKLSVLKDPQLTPDPSASVKLKEGH